MRGIWLRIEHRRGRQGGISTASSAHTDFIPHQLSLIRIACSIIGPFVESHSPLQVKDKCWSYFLSIYFYLHLIVARGNIAASLNETHQTDAGTSSEPCSAPVKEDCDHPGCFSTGGQHFVASLAQVNFSVSALAQSRVSTSPAPLA